MLGSKGSVKILKDNHPSSL